MNIKFQTFRIFQNYKKKCLYNYILFIFRYIRLDNRNYVCRNVEKSNKLFYIKKILVFYCFN